MRYLPVGPQLRDPPQMTSGEIEQRLKEASALDEEQAREKPGVMPTATLTYALVYAGKDTALQACPVLGLRLRSGDGRKIAVAVRDQMQAWTDQ